MLLVRPFPLVREIREQADALFVLLRVRLYGGLGKSMRHCSVGGGLLSSGLYLGRKDVPREPCTSHSAPPAVYRIENAAQNACLELGPVCFASNLRRGLGLLTTYPHSSVLFFSERLRCVLNPSKCLGALFLTKGDKCLAVRFCHSSSLHCGHSLKFNLQSGNLLCMCIHHGYFRCGRLG